MTPDKATNFGAAILSAFNYLLAEYPKVFAIGQGLWSPWYVGNSMDGLDKRFGKDRVIDTPVSELACTGAAVGASLFGYRPIVVHPRTPPRSPGDSIFDDPYDDLVGVGW